MKKNILQICLICVYVSIVIAGTYLLSCSDKGTTPTEATSSTTLAEVRNAGASMAGWTEDKTLYQFFSDSQSAHIALDGGFDRYLENNMMPSGFHTFINYDDTANLKVLDCIIMDFGTPANAASIFNKIVSLDVQEKYAVPGYAATVAVGQESGGGITAYAHINKFYFNFGLVGYETTPPASTQVASFITLFKSAIK